MQFGFRFQILPFTTSVRFSTKTLAYLAYKAFKAFKRWRLNPFQNYRSITSFSVDWPRTIRLVYASVSILSVCAIMLQVIVIQTRWNTKRLTKEFYKQKSRGSSCDPALSVHDNVNHHQDNTRDQHVNTSLDHSWLSWCWEPNDHWVLLRNFSILWQRKKKKRRQKNKGWLGYHRYPSNNLCTSRSTLFTHQRAVLPSPPPPKSEHWHRRQK